MASNKRVRVDFFQVDLPGTSFSDVIGSVAKRPLEKRAIELGDDLVRLESASSKGDVTKGDLVRIRMNDLPNKAARNRKSGPMPLKPDEGVGEHAAFLYHEPTRVLLLQRSRFVYPSTVLRFLEQIAGIDGPGELVVVLEPHAAADFKRLSNPQRLQVSVARMKDPRQLGKASADSGDSLNGFLDMITDTKARNANLTLTAGRGDHTMSTTIKRFARDLLGIGGKKENVVKKLQIVGTDGEDNKLAVDLVEGRMIGEGFVEVDGRRRLPYNQRIAVLDDLFEGRRSELIKSYE